MVNYLNHLSTLKRGNVRIAHFYHIYADGLWRDPVKEHIIALRQSELFYNIDEFYIGMVGKKENTNSVKKFLKTCGVYYNLVAEQENGWEQVTMNKLRDFSHENDAWIFYAHTKGSSDPSPINIAWRKSMTYYNIINWKEAVSYLSEYDTVGTHWVTAPQDGKTFWWATTDYLKTLPPIGIENRHRAEDWIGITKSAKIYDMNPGWPQFGIFTTSW